MKLTSSGNYSKVDFSYSQKMLCFKRKKKQQKNKKTKNKKTSKNQQLHFKTAFNIHIQNKE